MHYNIGLLHILVEIVTKSKNCLKSVCYAVNSNNASDSKDVDEALNIGVAFIAAATSCCMRSGPSSNHSSPNLSPTTPPVSATVSAVTSAVFVTGSLLHDASIMRRIDNKKYSIEHGATSERRPEQCWPSPRTYRAHVILFPSRN